MVFKQAVKVNYFSFAAKIFDKKEPAGIFKVVSIRQLNLIDYLRTSFLKVCRPGLILSNASLKP